MTGNRQSLHNVTWRLRGIKELLGRQFIWRRSLREAAEINQVGELGGTGWEGCGGRGTAGVRPKVEGGTAFEQQSRTSITWEFVRNAKSWALLQAYRIRNSEWGGPGSPF